VKGNEQTYDENVLRKMVETVRWRKMNAADTGLRDQFRGPRLGSPGERVAELTRYDRDLCEAPLPKHEENEGENARDQTP